MSVKSPSDNAVPGALDMSLAFGALFLVYGVHLPYLPVWLESRGLDTQAIAILTALPFIVRLAVSPLIAVVADQRANHATITLLLSVAAFASVLMLSQGASFWPLLVCSLALSLCMTSMMPLLETLTMAGVRQNNIDYGSVRLWGSWTFIAASMGAGFMIERTDTRVIIWLLAGSCLSVIAASALLWRKTNNAHGKISLRDLGRIKIGRIRLVKAQSDPTPDVALADGLIDSRVTHLHRVGTHAADASVDRPAKASVPSSASVKDAARLFRQPRFALLLLAAGGAQATHALYYTYGTLHWLSLGITPSTAGLLWTLGVLAEIALFARASQVMAFVGVNGLLVLGCLGAIIRWTAMAFDPGFASLLPLQLLHGLSFGATHLAAVSLVADMVPERLQASGQALLASIGMGVAMGLA
ncbi:MAG: MFS transporter, partial [Pseudomonadota bacterium]